MAKTKKKPSKVKSIKKIVKSKPKKVAIKKTAKKKIVSKVAKKVVVKTSSKKKVVSKKKIVKKAPKKVVQKASKKVSLKEKPAKVKIAVIETKVIAPPVKVVAVKPEKKPKMTKEELQEEKEMLMEQGYAWDSGSVSDMKNYEPSQVFRKPDPPQPKFTGKKDTRTRYSDKELKEFKDIIVQKISESEKDYELLKNTLAHRDEHGTDDTSPTFKVLEDGSDAMSREEIAQLASRQEKHIQNLKNALIRIANKTYGICRVTGLLIPKERLRSVPHATLSIEAKLSQRF